MNNIEYLPNGDFDNALDRGWSGAGWYFWDEVDGQYCYGPYPSSEIAKIELEKYAKNL
jgi:hypothetical protein